MNEITKAKISDVKNRLIVIKNNILLLKNQIEMSINHIRNFEQESIKRQLDHESIIENQINAIREEIITLENEIVEKRKMISKIKFLYFNNF